MQRSSVGFSTAQGKRSAGVHVEEVGGFGSSPKYPRPPYWIHLLLFQQSESTDVRLTFAEIAADTHGLNSMRSPCGTSPPTVTPLRAHHLCHRRLQCWVNKAEPLVSAAKLAARDRTLNEWFKVSSEQLSQLINLLMAMHVWKEAGVGDVGILQLLHHFRWRQNIAAESRPDGVLPRLHLRIQRVLTDQLGFPSSHSNIRKVSRHERGPSTLSLQGANERKESTSMPSADRGTSGRI